MAGCIIMRVLLQPSALQSASACRHQPALLWRLTIGMMVDGKVACVASSTTTTLNCLEGPLLIPALSLESLKNSPADEQVPATTCKDSR